MSKKKALVIGTRPKSIKVAPLISSNPCIMVTDQEIPDQIMLFASK